MAAFVTVLLLSNVLGAGKRAVVDLPWIGEWPFGAGILFFPISYIIGDVLNEVYGYGRARRCIWAGFAATLRSDEHTSELQSLMHISYPVFCLKKNNRINTSSRLRDVNSKHLILCIYLVILILI